MDTVQATPQQNIPKALLKLVQAIGNGGAHTEAEQEAAGPWDSVIREALEPLGALGPHPEPWLGVLGPQPEPWRMMARHQVEEMLKALLVAMRPESADAVPPHLPLIASHAFWSAVARTVVKRAEIMQEFADAAKMNGAGGAASYIGKFADDYCGNGIRPKWPPIPHPEWLERGPDSTDLLVVAAVFQQAATEAFNPALQKSLAAASAKITSAGLAKIQ